MRECRDEGELRAFLDGELPSGVVAATETHVQTCRDCRQELAQLEANRTWAGERLAALAPRSEVGPPAGQAWARLNERARGPISWKERAEEMFGLVNRRWRPALVGLALIAVLALAFSLEPVRVAAGDFLSIFRVRQFAVIPMGPEQMERMEEIYKSESDMPVAFWNMHKHLKVSLEDLRAKTGKSELLPSFFN